MGCINYVIAKIEFIGHHPRLGDDTLIPINTVLRWGCCNFLEDGSWEADNNTLLTERNEKLPIKTQDYVYQIGTDSFVEAV